jgi:hypothetical protein
VQSLEIRDRPTRAQPRVIFGYNFRLYFVFWP